MHVVHLGWRRLVLGAVVAAAVDTGAGRPLAAQTTIAVTPRTDGSDVTTRELLARLVTLHLDRVPLQQALKTVAAQAKVVIGYQQEWLGAAAHPVTVNVTKQPLGSVLTQLLAGTQLHVVVTAANAIVLQPDDADIANGSITGIVTDAATKQPVVGAAVTVDSGRAVKTRANGLYVVTDVSAGMHRVTVRLLGYRVASVLVTVHADERAVADIALAASATVLNDVVTTATGDRRRLEVGNAVGTIKADSIVQTTLIRNVSDLLQARVPGVVVQNTSGDVGAPSRIRLRGVNSIALNNDPIIIVDGVRLNTQTTSSSLQTNVGSQRTIGQLQDGNTNSATPLAPSRLDDIDPNTIESIDVLRGPSASSLYGTDAANGVIVIKTKKGQVGSWRTSVMGDYGESVVPGTFPEAWLGWGRQDGSQETTSCTLAGGGLTVAGGSCVLDSVTHFNPQNYGPMKTLGTGSNRSLSASLSGGTETLQQFFSARGASIIGMAKMSDISQRTIARYWNVPAPSWMVHPNTEQDLDGTSRTTVNVSPKVDVSLSSSGIYRNVLNSGSGLLRSDAQGVFSAADTLAWFPSDGQRTEATSNVKRGLLATTANARPAGWLALVATGGGDYGLRTDESNLNAKYCTPALVAVNSGGTACPSGRTVSRGETFVTTAHLGANLSFTPWSWLSLRTALGEDYSHIRFYNMQVGNSSVTGCPLAFGTTLLTPSPVCVNNRSQQYAVNESRDESATAGVYLEETITAFGLYYTFGVRRDLASAFGSQVTNSPPKFPKLNLSYPVSDQSYFPKQPYVTSLRIRAAYGQSGNQASQTAVLNNYIMAQSTFSNNPVSVPRIDITSLGNADLRPEKSTEWEGGVDISFLENERIHLEATLYHKFTRNMITSVPLTPSLGYYSLYYNLGDVENRGLEVGATARLFDTRAVSWDVSLNGSKNTNKLVRKAPSLPPYGPTGNSFVEGYPLFGYWGVPVASYHDLNNDGILEPQEIIFGQQRYMGAPYPKGELTYGSTIALWNGAVRVSANIDHIIEQTTKLTLGGANRPRAAVDPTAPLAQQAAYLESASNDGYIGASSSLRLNEMSASYMLPTSLVRRVHAQSLAVTVAGRNLGLWSSYAGKDPNVDTSNLLGEASQDGGLAIPQPRSWTLRFNLGL